MIIRQSAELGCEVLCARHIFLNSGSNHLYGRFATKLTTRWLSIPRRHFTRRAESSLEIPSNDKPGDGTNPWATSCELMNSRLEVETTDDSWVLSKKGELRDDIDGPSKSHRTSFLGVVVILCRRRTRRTWVQLWLNLGVTCARMISPDGDTCTKLRTVIRFSEDSYQLR